MDFYFNTLTKDFLRDHVSEFINMNNANLKNEYWEMSHFLAELNMKWQLSFYVADAEKEMKGFLIASEKEQRVHIHKFVVDAPVQNMGLGSRMITYLKERTDKPLSLKVEIENEKAIQFYLRKGFVTMETHNSSHLMTCKH